MDFLLAKYEKAIRDFKDNAFTLPCLKTGWEKLDKYYCLSDLTQVYVAIIVLHSKLKFNYLDKRWPKKWAKEAQKKVKDFWNTQYKLTVISLPQQPSEETSDESPNEFLAWFNADRPSLEDTDELECYLAQPTLPKISNSAREWWLESAQCHMFPNLSRMAIDLLSIPAMSAEPERLFSGAKLTITDQRGSLQAQSIEATECLKSWYKSMECT